ncbi:MAG: tetratricopeptide repeat protein [Kutzneria sp.]|nr:tetratricopeptide repeat protein [Kutzneria sp.]
MPFGQELRRLRQQHELSLRNLAQIVRFTPGYLSKVENGRTPSAELARACDDALGAGGTLIVLASIEQRIHPAQLPAAVATFVGRTDQLRRLDATLNATGRQGAPNVAIIDGPPGVGKTTLALCWSHQVVDRFPDGQLYVDLRGHSSHDRPVGAGDVLADFLVALGLPASGVPRDLDRKAALYRSMVANRTMLIVLDNAADSSQVEPLLPASSHCAVVVTSRERLSSVALRTDALHLTLGPMTASEATDLLGRIIGADRARAESAEVAILANRCDHLPLALRIAAERAVAQPHHAVRDLIDELDVAGRLEALTSYDSVPVRTVFDWSYRRLDAEAARLFRLLGLHRGAHISTPAAAALVGLPVPRTRGLLERLTGAHLVRSGTRDRFHLHDLLQDYAAELAISQECERERVAAVRRLGQWYVHTAHAAAKLLAPFRGEQLEPEPLVEGVTPLSFDTSAAALRWCDAELANFVPVIQLAVDNGVHPAAWQLAIALWNYLLLRKPWSVWTMTHTLAREATLAAGDRGAEGWVTTNLAEAYRRIGEHDRSGLLYDKALRLRQQAHDRYGEGWALAGSAFLAVDRGDPDRASDYANRALAIFTELGDRQGIGATLVTIGDVHRYEGRLDDALRVATDALAVYQEIGVLDGLSWVLTKLAEIHLARGDHEAALRQLELSVAACQRIGDRWGEAAARSRGGEVLFDLGRVAEALTSWETAAECYQEVGDGPRAAELRSRVHDDR